MVFASEKASRIQCDEIWSFCHAKQKNVADAKAAPTGAGDVWTWTALDADTKMIVSFFVGDRSGESAMILMDDLRSRLANRVNFQHGVVVAANRPGSCRSLADVRLAIREWYVHHGTMGAMIGQTRLWPSKMSIMFGH